MPEGPDIAKLQAENERVARALRESEAKFGALANQSLVGIAITEAGRFVYTNATFSAMFGYAEPELRTLGLADLAIEADRSKLAEGIQQQQMTVFRGLRKEGTVIEVEIHANALPLGDKPRLFSVVVDVTERVQTERALVELRQKLTEQAVSDPLTGLYNRRYLAEALERELVIAERHGHPVSVIMTDVDHFKTVNDHYGPLAGDEILRAFAALLKRSARASDIYCRYGGEEFVLVLPQMSAEKAVMRAEQLRRTLAAAPIRYGATAIPITASFGVAAYPDHGLAGARIIEAADKALHEAKTSGRNRVRLSEGKAAA
jgi:diguanylate cyclase (GGDEF)-like protein/PAS domain S-box-containing protein